MTTEATEQQFTVGQPLTERQQFHDLPVGTEVTHETLAGLVYTKTDDGWYSAQEGGERSPFNVNYFDLDGSNRIHSLPEQPESPTWTVGEPVGSRAALRDLPVGSRIRWEDRIWTKEADDLWTAPHFTSRTSSPTECGWLSDPQFGQAYILDRLPDSQAVNEPAQVTEPSLPPGYEEVPTDFDDVVSPSYLDDMTTSEFHSYAAALALGAASMHSVDRGPVERCLIEVGIDPAPEWSMDPGSSYPYFHSPEGNLTLQGLPDYWTPRPVFRHDRGGQQVVLRGGYDGNIIGYRVLSREGVMLDSRATHEDLAEIHRLRVRLREVGDNAHTPAQWCGVYSRVLAQIGAVDGIPPLVTAEEVAQQPQGTVWLTLGRDPVMLVRTDASENPAKTLRVGPGAGHWAPRLIRLSDRLPTAESPIHIAGLTYGPLLPRGIVINPGGVGYVHRGDGCYLTDERPFWRMSEIIRNWEFR